MKKNILKSIVTCFIFSLLFTVNAITGSAATATVTDTNGMAVGVITPYQVTTGSETERATFNTYNVVIQPDVASADGYTYAVMPITIGSAGGFNAQLALKSGFGGYGSAKAVLYKDAALTTPVSTTYYWSTYDTKAYTVDVDSAGTYFLRVSFYNGYAIGPVTLTYGVQTYNSELDRTLNSGEWMCSYQKNYGDVFWYKVKLNKDGYINVEEDVTISSTYVQLYNSKKSATLSDQVSISNYSDNYKTATFAAKKGTYYIKVSGGSNLIRIKYTAKTLKDSSGSSKKKATSLKAGKKKSGIVLSSDSTKKSDWYKFTVSKTKAVTVTFEGKVSSGSVKLTMYKANGDKFIGYRELNRYYTKNEIIPYTNASKDKLKKGTYYIKISKDTKATSGYYSIKFK